MTPQAKTEREPTNQFLTLSTPRRGQQMTPVFANILFSDCSGNLWWFGLDLNRSLVLGLGKPPNLHTSKLQIRLQTINWREAEMPSQGGPACLK